MDSEWCVNYDEGMSQYEGPLQVVETPAMRDRIRAIAAREKISQAQVVRDILRAGIDAREARA